MQNQEIIEKSKKIKFLLLDADGVLTDGMIYYGSYGEELKAFNIQDGLGLSLWRRQGKMSAIVTAKRSSLLKRRAKHLGILQVYQNAFRKIDIYEKIKKKYNLLDSEICFIGDDLIDIPVLKKTGLAVSVPDAPSEVKEVSDIITQHPGGSGAIREIIELILKSQGLWEKVLQQFYDQ